MKSSQVASIRHRSAIEPRARWDHDATSSNGGLVTPGHGSERPAASISRLRYPAMEASRLPLPDLVAEAVHTVEENPGVVWG